MHAEFFFSFLRTGSTADQDLECSPLLSSVKNSATDAQECRRVSGKRKSSAPWWRQPAIIHLSSLTTFTSSACSWADTLALVTVFEANGLASAPVIVAGSEEQKKEYLGRLTSEPLIASYCELGRERTFLSLSPTLRESAFTYKRQDGH